MLLSSTVKNTLKPFVSCVKPILLDLFMYFIYGKKVPPYLTFKLKVIRTPTMRDSVYQICLVKLVLR